MNNHFHLLVETPQGNLAEFMRRFNVAYIGYFNRRHKRTGHLYQGRYKAILVDKDAYLSVLSRYIHLNPVRVKSMEKVDTREKYRRVASYPWSSLDGYLKKRKRLHFVRYDLVLSEFGGDTDRARKAYRKALIDEMTEGKNIYDHVVGQTVIGGETFISWVKANLLGEEEDKDAPAHRVIKGYGAKEDIIQTIARRSGKSLEQIRHEKGLLRKISMDMLYRHGGLTNGQIGALFGVDSTAVSQERRRLRHMVSEERKIADLVCTYNTDVSRIKK
jgi:hypothetical protein